MSTLRQLLPDQAGVLWISLLVFLAVGFDHARPWSPRNIDLLIVQAIGWCFIGSLDLLVETSRRHDATRHGLIRLVFEVVTVLSTVLLVRMTWRSVRPDPSTWTPAIGIRPLAGIAALTVALSLAMPFFRPAEDSSYFTNLGGQRLRERGLLPYGDPMLTRTPGAMYAPLMYAAQAGVQFLLRAPTNNPSPDLPVLGEHSEYNAPSPVSSLILLAGFQLLGAWALFRIGRQWAGDSLGLAFAALYCGSAAVLGVGGSGDQIGGMTFVSHIVPPAAHGGGVSCISSSRWFRACCSPRRRHPASTQPSSFQSGLVTTGAARQRRRFGSSPVSERCLWSSVFGCSSASRPADGLSLVATILRDTLGHQTDPKGYGMAPFGLWGQQTGVLKWMLEPLVGTVAMASPGFLLYCCYLGATAVLAQTCRPGRTCPAHRRRSNGRQLVEDSRHGKLYELGLPVPPDRRTGPGHPRATRSSAGRGSPISAGCYTQASTASRNLAPDLPSTSLRRQLGDEPTVPRLGDAHDFERSSDAFAGKPSVPRPRLSVIIPVYNEAQNVERLVEKVLRVPIDKELIVIDDGSTDGTAEIVRTRVAALAPNIRVACSREEPGQGSGHPHRPADRHGRDPDHPGRGLGIRPVRFCSDLEQVRRPDLYTWFTVRGSRTSIDTSLSGIGSVIASLARTTRSATCIIFSVSSR